MDCNEIRDRLPLFLHDDLAAGETASIKDHCDSCPACRKEYASMQQLRRFLDGLPTPRVEINLARIYAGATRRQEMRMRRWRRATYALVGVAAMMLLVFGLKLEVRLQAHQMVVSWNGQPETVQPAPQPSPPQDFARVELLAPEVSPKDLQLVKDIVHALAAHVETLDQNHQGTFKALATRLETMQYGDNQRWKATQRDVAALYSVCIGPHDKDRGGKP